MKFKTITYQRVKNLGNYESERIELTVELSEDDNFKESFDLIKKKACEALKIDDLGNEIAF
jgi:hypothetical protein